MAPGDDTDQDALAAEWEAALGGDEEGGEGGDGEGGGDQDDLAAEWEAMMDGDDDDGAEQYVFDAAGDEISGPGKHAAQRLAEVQQQVFGVDLEKFEQEPKD